MSRKGGLRSNKPTADGVPNIHTDASSDGSTGLRSDLATFGIDGKQFAELSNDNQHVVSIILKGFIRIMSQKDDEISQLQGEVSQLKKRIEKLEEVVDANSSYERRDTLVVRGEIPAHEEEEDCIRIVSTLFRSQLKINMNAEDISTAHRLGGKPRTQGPDKRDIILKLCRRDLKKDILAACRQMKPYFFVNESLTPTRSTVMYVLRQTKKRFPGKIGNCRSFDGNVNVFIPMTHDTEGHQNRYRKLVINTTIALDDFLREHLSCSSSDFVNSWT